MIDRAKLTQIATNLLSADEFLVAISISSSNKIEVIIDSDKGISIDSCIRLSKAIEETLDRDAEDFELQVASAGLGLPFKVHRQFTKNIGKEVELIKTDGTKLEGTIKTVGEQSFELLTMVKEKLEGKSKRELIEKTIEVSFDEAKTVKNIIKF